jgi:hypothetical protein
LYSDQNLKTLFDGNVKQGFFLFAPDFGRFVASAAAPPGRR